MKIINICQIKKLYRIAEPKLHEFDTAIDHEILGGFKLLLDILLQGFRLGTCAILLHDIALPVDQKFNEVPLNVARTGGLGCIFH